MSIHVHVRSRVGTSYNSSSAGVISGIGKGVIASSTGLLLKTIGLKVSSIKIDPYLNVDAGTMSPLGTDGNQKSAKPRPFTDAP